MTKLVDRTGKRYGRLFVIMQIDTRGTRARWLVSCDCGTVLAVDGKHLQSGRTKSCGCLASELASKRMTGNTYSQTHGHAPNGGHSPTYHSWYGMRQRTLNPKNQNYSYYGGRGITVCDAWRDSFEAFLADMGERPEGDYSLDRIDNEGNYEPGNCRWATSKQQNNNRRKRAVN